MTIDSSDYKEHLRLTRSLLIVSSLQERQDRKVLELVEAYGGPLTWQPLHDLMIDADVWTYIVDTQGYDPKLVFCHPDVLKATPSTSLHYRGLCGLSLKTAQDYVGTLGSLEAGNPRARLSDAKALKMTQVYNTFISSIIRNSTDWTLENGYRTVIATLGITLDGVMRNTIGSIAEKRIRTLVLDWLRKQGLIISSNETPGQGADALPSQVELVHDMRMTFGSEPDIAFYRGETLLATVEIKGGTDSAGALERYGAATKSFQQAIASSPHCKNFYLAAVYTSELERRMDVDRLVERRFNIISLLDSPESRTEFFTELFHHTLRLI